MGAHDLRQGGLFDPTVIGRMPLRNRLAVAPMTRVSASADGRANAAVQAYYGAFAQGGFGLVVTEGIYTDKAFSQGYLYQPGLSDAAQRDAWMPIVRAVHTGGARMIAQLMHGGALSQGNPHRSGTRGPSAVRPKGQQMAIYRGGGPYAVPQAMVDAEIAEAVRAAAGADFTVGVRISQGKVNDFAYKWRDAAEAEQIFGALGQLPLDYVHTTEFEAWKGAFGEGPSLAALARRHAGLRVIANGSLQDPARAAAMVAAGEADLVSLGRGALTHADWPRRVRDGRPIHDFDREILSPIADLDNARRRRERQA